MEKDEVPQDQTRALQGQRKAMYAVDEDGRYGVIRSSGWEAEELVLDQAIEQYTQLAHQARQRVQHGLSSPLEYYMYRQRMDVTVLAQATGFYKWQIRRHSKPAVFASLSTSKLQRYADALGLTIAGIRELPADPCDE